MDAGSFTVSYKQETTTTQANTLTTRSTDIKTSTMAANCQCPDNVRDNYCNFINKYTSTVSWAGLRWTGDESLFGSVPESPACSAGVAGKTGLLKSGA